MFFDTAQPFQNFLDIWSLKWDTVLKNKSGTKKNKKLLYRIYQKREKEDRQKQKFNFYYDFHYQDSSEKNLKSNTKIQ